MASPDLRRRVVFQGWGHTDEWPPFDRIAAAEAVAALPETGWSFTSLDFTTGVLIDEIGSEAEPTCLRCFRLRAGDQTPHKLNAKRVVEGVPLQANESITDWTHVAIWGDGYAAHDSGRDAPSLARLSSYLGEMVDQHVHFWPLYDRSLVDELEGLDEVKAIEIKFKLSRAEQVSGLVKGGMFEGLLKVARDAEAATITTKVSVGASRKHFLTSKTRQEVVGLADKAEEFLDALTITGVKGTETVHIDLLRKRLDQEARVKRSKTLGNAPDPAPMHAQIKASRKRLERKPFRLNRAVRVK